MARQIHSIVITSSVLALGIAVAYAQTVSLPPAPDLYGQGSARGRLASRLLRDFDRNKDGQITTAELDKVLAGRFAQLAGKAGVITQGQFVRSGETALRHQSEIRFHRLDWNGDGALSLEEFRAPIRARFEARDRDGTGTISCSSGRARVSKICRGADLNKDGKITHAEFDKAAADNYAVAVKGSGRMTLDQFYNLELAQFETAETRRFKRLDTNHDGKLSESEFATPGKKMFARLDRNKDGVLSKDELTSPRHVARGKRVQKAG